MNTLFLAALDEKGDCREFSCSLFSLEAIFDFLNQIVAQGHTLLSAYVVDDLVRTNLPLAAFDGLHASAGIHTLEQEWQTILSRPLWPNSIHYQELIELTSLRLDTYKSQIAGHERMIDRFSHWLQRLQDAPLTGTINYSLIQQYKRQLVAHQVQLTKKRFQANLVTNRLDQLMAY